MLFHDIVVKEGKIDIQHKELDIYKFRQTADLSAKESQLKSRERELEIRERLIEEQRIEFSYKREQLN